MHTAQGSASFFASQHEFKSGASPPQVGHVTCLQKSCPTWSRSGTSNAGISSRDDAVFPAGMMWRLSAGGVSNLGLCCTQEGLFLGRTALIGRCAGGYAVRPATDLRRLLACAYRADADLDRLMAGLAVVRSALAERNLCLAQIAALQLQLSDLPDLLARADLEAEDCSLTSSAATSWHAAAGIPQSIREPAFPQSGLVHPDRRIGRRRVDRNRPRQRRRAHTRRDPRPAGRAAPNAVGGRARNVA